MEETLGTWNFPFTSKWDTRNTSKGSSNENQIRLPIVSSLFKPFTVDWGDGSQDSISRYDAPELLHTYQKSGVYIISLSGESFGFGFSGVGDRLKILSLSDWGGYNIFISGFQGCENLTLEDVTGVPENEIISMRSLFKECTSIERINGISKWDVSKAVNMTGVFSGATKFNQDISTWNFNKNVILDAFMEGKGTENFNPNFYDSLLRKWSVNLIGGRTQANKKIGMGGIKFTANGKPFRDILVQNGFQITDGGQA